MRTLSETPTDSLTQFARYQAFRRYGRDLVLPSLRRSFLQAVAPAVDAVSIYESGSAQTNHTQSEPTGSSSGDLLVGALSIDAARTVTSPSGWSDVQEIANGGAVRLIVSTITRGASAPDLTWVLGASDGAVGGIFRISGFDTSGPVDVSDNNTGGSNSSAVCPDITTTVADTLILHFFGGALANTTEDTGNPAGTTLGWVKNSAGCSGGGAYDTQASIGATGTSTFNLNNNMNWATIKVAIAPTAAVGDLVSHGRLLSRERNFLVN